MTNLVSFDLSVSRSALPTANAQDQAILVTTCFLCVASSRCSRAAGTYVLRLVRRVSPLTPAPTFA